MGKTKELKPTKHAVAVQFSPEHMELIRAKAAQDHRTPKNFIELLVIREVTK